MSAKHTPGLFVGFLGNGAWLIVVHTKKCSRQRRRVTPGRRARDLLPNRDEQFARAAAARKCASLNEHVTKGPYVIPH